MPEYVDPADMEVHMKSFGSPILFAAIALAPALVSVACGGDKPGDTKTATNASGSATSATPAATLRPVTPANVPNTETASGIRISEEIRTKCGISDEEAYFAFDSAVLREGDKVPLDKVAVCFTTGPLKGRTVRLVGHADPRGPNQYNQDLGHSRA